MFNFRTRQQCFYMISLLKLIEHKSCAEFISVSKGTFKQECYKGVGDIKLAKNSRSGRRKYEKTKNWV
ncbi:MAG: hypothetical protein SCARUB_04209 [Candidatus Scalindua rubra]|uniref:Uncharacterized protein n=1 Tax=Candidatus Scalindua rubra TaxID=1872076 RepID=A0A1E3X4T3_9BACT|nr:MAG: hypothetical protein SCARUB_04209 [Candidatus Scalindua rubra]